MFAIHIIEQSNDKETRDQLTRSLRRYSWACLSENETIFRKAVSVFGISFQSL